MSVSTRVVGVRDLDGRFDQMWKIKEQCQEAEVSLPKEVIEYFEGINEDEYWDKPECLEDIQRERIENSAREVDFKYDLRIAKGDIDCEGLEIQVADIPDYVKTIRIYRQA